MDSTETAKYAMCVAAQNRTDRDMEQLSEDLTIKAKQWKLLFPANQLTETTIIRVSTV